MPTTAERNSAFDAVKVKVTEIKNSLPGLLTGYIDKYLTTARILEMVDAALTAAENTRAKGP